MWITLNLKICGSCLCVQTWQSYDYKKSLLLEQIGPGIYLITTKFESSLIFCMRFTLFCIYFSLFICTILHLQIKITFVFRHHCIPPILYNSLKLCFYLLPVYWFRWLMMHMPVGLWDSLYIFMCVLNQPWTLSQSAQRLRPAITNQQQCFPGWSWLCECGGGLDRSSGCWRPPRLQRAQRCNLVFSLMMVMSPAEWKRGEEGNERMNLLCKWIDNKNTLQRCSLNTLCCIKILTKIHF